VLHDLEYAPLVIELDIFPSHPYSEEGAAFLSAPEINGRSAAPAPGPFVESLFETLPHPITGVELRVRNRGSSWRCVCDVRGGWHMKSFGLGGGYP